MHTMNIEVCIIGWNRPAYLKQTLDAVSNLTKSPYDINVFLDGDNLSEQSMDCYDVACRCCGVEHVKLNSSREGIPAQWWKALCRTEEEGVDAVLVLEDDVVVEPLYLDAIESMLRTYSDPRVSFVSSFPDKINPCAPSLPWTTGDHLLGVATTRESWNAIKPYYQLFLDGEFPHWKETAVQILWQDKMLHSTPQWLLMEACHCFQNIAWQSISVCMVCMALGKTTNRNSGAHCQSTRLSSMNQ